MIIVMAIRETEAIILSVMSHGDTSKIVRLYSQELGKISVIAKGVRKAKSKIGGMLDPLNHVKVVFYFKDTRDLHTLAECDLIESYPVLRNNLESLAIGLAVLENITHLVIEEEPNAALFQLIAETLSSLEQSSRNLFNIYWYFLLSFLKISGFGINLHQCRSCEKETIERSLYFSISEGGLICNDCGGGSGLTKLSGETVQVFKSLVEKVPEKLHNLTVSPAAEDALTKVLEGYFRFHFEGYRKPESLKLLI